MREYNSDMALGLRPIPKLLTHLADIHAMSPIGIAPVNLQT